MCIKLNPLLLHDRARIPIANSRSFGLMVMIRDITNAVSASLISNGNISA